MQHAESSRVVARLEQEIGQGKRTILGEISAQSIQRFAMTVGETNPLYFDVEYARSHGYTDLPAPVTMLSSIVNWQPGPLEAHLRPDGTVDNNDPLTAGFRRLGGGQRLELVSPVVAGDRITLVSTMTQVYSKPGADGDLIFLIYENRYLNQSDDLRVICTQTLILR